jgi:formyltetrahydrofolate deformylase
MRVTLTAVGPPDRAVAERIVQHVLEGAAKVAEIQTYDHASLGFAALLLRMQWPGGWTSFVAFREQARMLGEECGVSVRTWSPDQGQGPPRLALCVTHRSEPHGIGMWREVGRSAAAAGQRVLSVQGSSVGSPPNAR